jgi:fatty acid desaturase
MDVEFHTGVDTRDLLQRRDTPAAIRLLLILIAGGVSAVLLTLAETPAAWTLGIGLQALAQLSCFAMLHECAHRTAFKTHVLNQVGAWIASLNQIAAPALFREFHFAHHRHTHEVERDPELGGLELQARWPRHVFWLATVSGLPILGVRLLMTVVAALNPPWSVWGRALPFVSERRRTAVVWHSRLLVALHVGFVTAAWHLEPRLLRLYLAVVLAHALLSIYVTCEHRGLPTEGSVLERTRSFDPGPLGRFLMWNMPYHAEHHAYPAVPFHTLPRLHDALRPQLRHRVGGVFMLHLRRGQCPQPSASP